MLSLDQFYSGIFFDETSQFWILKKKQKKDFESYLYAFFWPFSLCTSLKEARDNHATTWRMDCLKIPSLRLVISLPLYSVCHKGSEDGGNMNRFFAII